MFPFWESLTKKLMNLSREQDGLGIAIEVEAAERVRQHQQQGAPEERLSAEHRQLVRREELQETERLRRDYREQGVSEDLRGRGGRETEREKSPHINCSQKSPPLNVFVAKIRKRSSPLPCRGII